MVGLPMHGLQDTPALCVVQNDAKNRKAISERCVLSLQTLYFYQCDVQRGPWAATLGNSVNKVVIVHHSLSPRLYLTSGKCIL